MASKSLPRQTSQSDPRVQHWGVEVISDLLKVTQVESSKARTSSLSSFLFSIPHLTWMFGSKLECCTHVSLSKNLSEQNEFWSSQEHGSLTDVGLNATGPVTTGVICGNWSSLKLRLCQVEVTILPTPPSQAVSVVSFEGFKINLN